MMMNEIYTEDEVRTSEQSFTDKLSYVFEHFYNFTLDFKRELKEQAILETMEKFNESREQATKEINEYIADSLLDFFSNELIHTSYYNENYKLLKDIKEGTFNEFINIEELIPFN